MATSICRQSEHDSAITINATYNGYYLSKCGWVDSPLALIEDESTRKLIMKEAEALMFEMQNNTLSLPTTATNNQTN